MVVNAIERNRPTSRDQAILFNVCGPLSASERNVSRRWADELVQAIGTYPLLPAGRRTTPEELSRLNTEYRTPDELARAGQRNGNERR